MNLTSNISSNRCVNKAQEIIDNICPQFPENEQYLLSKISQYDFVETINTTRHNDRNITKNVKLIEDINKGLKNCFISKWKIICGLLKDSKTFYTEYCEYVMINNDNIKLNRTQITNVSKKFAFRFIQSVLYPDCNEDKYKTCKFIHIHSRAIDWCYDNIPNLLTQITISTNNNDTNQLNQDITIDFKKNKQNLSETKLKYVGVWLNRLFKAQFMDKYGISNNIDKLERIFDVEWQNELIPQVLSNVTSGKKRYYIPFMNIQNEWKFHKHRQNVLQQQVATIAPLNRSSQQIAQEENIENLSYNIEQSGIQINELQETINDLQNSLEIKNSECAALKYQLSNKDAVIHDKENEIYRLKLQLETFTNNNSYYNNNESNDFNNNNINNEDNDNNIHNNIGYDLMNQNNNSSKFNDNQSLISDENVLNGLTVHSGTECYQRTSPNLQLNFDDQSSYYSSNMLQPLNLHQRFDTDLSRISSMDIGPYRRSLASVDYSGVAQYRFDPIGP